MGDGREGVIGTSSCAALIRMLIFEFYRAPSMLKWLIVLVAAVFIVGLLQPRLARLLQLGRLPGDLRVRLRGRDYIFP
ncbi:MAG: DUF2905 domain-containing protein, partial [Sulfuritalea sp.]